jgi:hypothetical protein
MNLDLLREVLRAALRPSGEEIRAVVKECMPPDAYQERTMNLRPKVGIIGAGDGTVPGRAPIETFLGGWAAA